jgi:ABC-type nitrate/sulfonate/bicarbonate transport system substrate-binding protein
VRKLHYGIATNKSAPNVRFGIEKGFFAEEGIDLEIRLTYGGPELASSFAARDVEIGEFGSPPALTAIAQRAPIKIIGSGMRRKFLMYLGVRSDIKDYAELRGKRLGLLTLGSCNDWLARRLWSQAGLDPEHDLKMVVVKGDYPRILAQMAEGKFEAILTIEPDLASGECQGLLRAWAAACDPEYLPRYQWVVMVARPDFIDREPELLQAVLRACARSSRYMAEHPDEWAQFLVASHGVSPEAARRAVGRELPQTARDCRIDIEGLRQAIALQMELGAFSDDLPVEQITDLRFLPDAFERGDAGRCSGGSVHGSTAAPEGARS